MKEYAYECEKKALHAITDDYHAWTATIAEEDLPTIGQLGQQGTLWGPWDER